MKYDMSTGTKQTDKVFVSSTYRDNKERWDVIQKAITMTGYGLVEDWVVCY